jgi:hypothetical protein
LEALALLKAGGLLDHRDSGNGGNKEEERFDEHGEYGIKMKGNIESKE